MRICKEMVKLREALTKMNVEWEDRSDVIPEMELEAKKALFPNLNPRLLDTSIHRTFFWYRDYQVSVIYGYSTYGGPNGFGDDPQKLEVMISNNEPIGWLTADEVLTKLEEL